MKNTIYNRSHYLSAVRLDNFFRLMHRARWRLEPERIPQTVLMGLTSLVLSPFALLEGLVCALPLALHKREKDPVFIVGFWRSGTTYLQNLLTRDPQFAWADPVSTSLFSNYVLLGRLLRGAVGGGLEGARPMDNVRYALDLPMEETFAVGNFSPWSIDHMIALPICYESFISSAFTRDMTPRQRRSFRRAYDYMVTKMSWTGGGKQLLFKSPDNTARMEELLRLYPRAKFINIHRDPYTTVRSTIHMFRAQMDMLRLTPLPACEDFEVLIEDVVIDLFERMYRQLFALEKELPPGQMVTIAYEDFVRAPEEGLRQIYDGLALEGFDEALPHFRTFIDSQKNYRKNEHRFSPRLQEKVEQRLGFYFERYGYEYRKEVTV